MNQSYNKLQQRITLKMADKKRADFYADLIMILCRLNFCIWYGMLLLLLLSLILSLSPTNGSILCGLIIRYLVIKGMLLKIRPGRAEHIRGGETCLIHPTLTGHVLMVAPILYICACVRTHARTHTHAHAHAHAHAL